MIIAQVCLRLATVKCHSKMCSFAVLEGSRGFENQSVSGVTTISLTQCNTSPSHRVDQVVDCGLWNVGPLQRLWEVARYWQELEHTVVYANPEHPKHAQWVTCPVGMLAMQELGCFQLPGIMYRSLQHGAVHYHAATWGDGRGWMAQQWASGSRHGISAFKMPSIKCTCARCPYHTPAHTITPPPTWATWSTTLTSTNRSPIQHHTCCLPSALFSENRDSSGKRTALQSARCHQMWAFAHSSRLRWRTAVRSWPRWGWRACRWASLRRFLTVFAEILW